MWQQNTRPGLNHLRTGQEAAAAHQDALAEQEWLKGTQEAPQLPENFIALGDLYLRQLRFPEAVTAFQAAAKLDPQDGSVFLRLANAALGAGQSQAALEAYRQAAALQPDDADTLGLYGLLAARLGSTKDALPALKRAHQLKPEQPRYVLELVRQEIGVGDNAGAERDLAPFLKNHPNDGEANRLMATLYQKKPPTPENLKTALDLAARAVAGLPDRAEAFSLLGQLQLEAGGTAAAQRAFQTAQTLDPNSVEALSGLLTCETRLGRTQDAARSAARLQTVSVRNDRITHLKDTLKLRPEDNTARLELARLKEASGDVNAAGGYFLEAVRHAPG